MGDRGESPAVELLGLSEWWLDRRCKVQPMYTKMEVKEWDMRVDFVKSLRVANLPCPAIGGKVMGSCSSR